MINNGQKVKEDVVDLHARKKKRGLGRPLQVRRRDEDLLSADTWSEESSL